MDGLYLIVIGSLVAVFVNVFIFPMWSGEQVYQELKWFDLVADSLEESVNMYVKLGGTEQPDFRKTVIGDFPNVPVFKKCQEAMNSSSCSKLDSLANSAKWEPPHGNFRHFFYPWPEYVKVGAVLRHRACEVMALHGCLHSEIQAPFDLRVVFQSEILELATKAAELVRTLGQKTYET